MDPAEPARLPCCLLPYPQNKDFFGRQKELDYVTKTLSYGSLQQSRRIALWGTGGIGKSQVALEYAYQQARGLIPSAVFWVPSETMLSVAQGFIEIALRLGLPGASQDYNMNRMVVMSWMSQSSKFVLRWSQLSSSIFTNVLLRCTFPAYFRQRRKLGDNSGILSNSIERKCLDNNAKPKHNLQCFIFDGDKHIYGK